MFRHRKKNQKTYSIDSNARLSQSKIKEILRTVTRDKAFYFYEEIGKPTRYMATSLLDFRNKINTVQSSSLVFHLRRKDFENWIREIIRDSELAERISKISPSDFDLNKKLYATVDMRIKELREMASTSVIVSEDLFTAPRLSDTELLT